MPDGYVRRYSKRAQYCLNRIYRIWAKPLLLVAACVISYQTHCADNTDSRVKAIVYQAYDFVGEQGQDMDSVQRAFENDARFRDDSRQLYIFMHAYNAQKKEAICVAQGKRPELVGKNMWGLRSPSGRLTFQEQTAIIEKKDEFWLEYEWLNPYTLTVQIKRSFFKKIVLHDGRNAWIGCGYWK